MDGGEVSRQERLGKVGKEASKEMKSIQSIPKAILQNNYNEVSKKNEV